MVKFQERSMILTPAENITEDIRRQGFDTRTALRAAREGKIEEWVQRFLTAGRNLLKS